MREGFIGKLKVIFKNILWGYSRHFSRTLPLTNLPGIFNDRKAAACAMQTRKDKLNKLNLK